ncbi:hypothetical protein N9J83_09005, partial [Opitutales bacterium]|nr:hypothetical protein [Opitutales bacterium]
ASSSNRPPSDINASNLTIVENSAIGTVIGEFNATDPDGDNNITYSLVPPLPSDLNLSLWLDASDASTITETNGSVSQWADKSGNGNHAVQENEARKPTFGSITLDGKTVINFDGSSDFLDSPNLSISQPYTFAIVAKTNNNSTGRDFLFDQSGSGGGRSIIAMDFNGKIQLWANSWGNTNFSTPFDFFVLSAVFNSSDSSLSLNGNNVANLNPGTSSLNGGVRIGAHQNTADFLKGSIAEFLIFNENLNSSARASVEAYIAHKWGLGANLPSSHPFKNGSSLFDLDANGTLTANQIFDYETDDLNYTITVRATDDHNVSYDKNFTINVTNVVEDLDGDGTEDHYDLDDDGDGLSDADEAMLGSDPLNGSSPVVPATSFKPKNTLTVAEDAAMGTVVGQFERLVESASPIKSYELIPHLPTSASPVLWLDASELNYAGETWQDRSLSNNHATRNGSAQGFPTVLRNYQNGHSVIHYSGAPKAYHDFQEIGDVRTVFWVVGRSSGSGSLLGDSDSSQFFSGTEQFWLNGMADSNVLSGDTFLRGRKIDGSTTPVPSSLEVLSFRSSADLNASRFGRSSNGRSFIGELGELIIFNQSLANWQMAQIERYLAQKWSLPIDRSVSEFSIDAEGVVRSAIKFNFDDTSSRSLLVRATNENNQSVINSHMVAITDVTGGASVSDIDGDGMSNELELTLGYDPYDANSKNTTPANLRSSNDLGILESVSVGSVIGKLIADDPDYLSELTYSFSTGEGAGDNSKVSISEGGEIKLLTSLDYEKQTSLSFRAKVVDENNASIEKAFTLSVIDIFEDENNNGVEDHLESDMDGDGIPNESDPDRDGDGVSNGDELQNGSDPDNAKSTNRPPTNLVNSSALSIQENQPKGAVISKFVPQDPDGVQGYSYLLVEGTGGTDNGLFEIDQHGNLSTSVVFDYENNASSYSVRIKAEDPYGKSVEKAFSISLTNSDQFSPISIDADLTLWLDASDQSTLNKSNTLGGAGQPKDGESVKFWADKSGQEHHAITSNSGTYLENSINEYYPSIDTTGDTFELVNSAESFDAWSEMTIFFVHIWKNDYSWQWGIKKGWDGTAGWVIERLNVGASQGLGLKWARPENTSTRLNGSGATAARYEAKVIAMKYDGSSTNLKYFANGKFIKESNETEPSFVSNTTDTLKIGNSYKWGEVLIFKNALPDTKRELIEGYLAHKWGMASELDEGHPFHENPVVAGFESYEANFSNRTPSDIYLKLDEQIQEGKPLGSLVNSIGVVDPDISNSFEYALVAGEGDEQNSFFKLSEDGELITAKAIDFEQHTELSLRVKVADDHNQSFSKALTITVVNVVEDADNDGIEDHEDPSVDTDQDGIEDSEDSDIDGDGMTNSEEIANGSDPRDANSTNHAPSLISSVATLSFRENQPAGILVGQLSAVDQDDGASHKFFLVAGEGDTDNSLFTLSEAGALRTALSFVYDNNASSYSIRVQVQDEYFASIENHFTVKLENDIWINPHDLESGLMLWLDASEYQSMDSGEYIGDLGIPANNGSINFWGDRSGNQHHARAVSSKPKFKETGFDNKPTIQFTNDTMRVDHSDTTFNNWSKLSLFMVWQTKSWITWTPLFGKTNSNNTTTDATWYFLARRPDLTPPNYRWQINGASASSSPEINTNYSSNIKSQNVLVLTYDGSHAKAWLNGNLAISTSYSGGLRSTEYPFTLGGAANELGSATIDFSEVVIFKQSLTDEKRVNLEGSLAHKWGLQSRFPSSHPHRNRLTQGGGFVVVEELPLGSIFGRISEASSDYNASHNYSLSETNSSNHNHLFSMDDNGTLSNLVVFDYETNSTEYKISVRASSNGALISEKTYPVFISDADEDMDDDGFSDAEETAYGSDPNDEESIPNTAPSNISGALSVLENADAGTVVGTLTTSDTDNHESFKYNLVSRTAGANAILWLDANNTDSILEKDGKIYEWRDLGGKGNHAVQSNPDAQPVRINDRVEFDGNDIMQISKDPFRGLQEPAIVVVAKWNQSMGWGNTMVSYHNGNPYVGWYLRQNNTSIDRLNFTIRGTSGDDDPLTNRTTSQTNLFLASANRFEEKRYLRHNGVEILNITDTGDILFSGANRSAIGGLIQDDENLMPSVCNLNGSIKELIVMNGKSAEEIEKLENHLASKWGVAINRPVDLLSNESFIIDENGTVTTTGPLDYEEDANRTIRIRATDPYGEFIEKELVVFLSNEVEDIDEDGIEDAIDEDADGDGINNETELTNGTDPYDAQSTNQVPTGISASGALTISENADAGTLVGNFTGTDPDNGQVLKFGLVADYPEHLSPTLWLDANASGSIDMNRSYVMSWSDKRGGPSLIQDEESRQPQMTGLELNELPVVEFLGNDYMYSNGVFPLSPTFTMFAVAGFDWVNSESDSLVSYDSFSGGGFMQWDAGNAHRFESRVWHHSNSGSLTSHKFYPQSDMGPALYQVSFDYEMGTMHGLLNGQSLGTTDYQTALHPRHVLRLFANNALNQFPHGFLAEFMVFEEALSAVDRKLVESYLGEKWALPMHDPIEHPLFKMEENGTLVTREELDFELDENHTITVRVYDEYNATYDKDFLVTVTNVVEDLDGDGIENHYDTDDDNDSILDDLDPDDDNDGFSDTDEIAYGSNPLDPNSVANAFPNFLDLNGTTIFENQPIGTRVGQLIAHDPDSNALLAFSFVDGNGSDNNSLFVIDENATVRTTTIFDYETDDHNYSIRVGVADEHNFSIEHSFTIKLLNIIEDNDRDGVEDHYDPDDDNDGFSDLDELDYGSDPLDPNSVANAAPDSLELNGSTVLENQPISALVGQLIGHDPDGNTTLTFSFVDGNGSGDNSLFVIDENATVRTTTMFDYETDDHNYSIRVGVSDEHNFSIERSFTINLLNIVEDHDQDGVEDHYDPDDDNDGFSDLDELAYGADPLDSKSVANAAPDSLELNGSTVLENLPIGSLVGELIGHDPDENTHLTYRFVDGNGSGDNSLFVIDENASVRTTTIFDYERDDHNYSILVRIADEHNFSIDRTFTLLLLNQNEPPFDFKSSADLEVKENQAMGSLVGKLTAKDPDMDSVLHFKLVEGAK